MKCSVCGETCSNNQRFCLKCGNPLNPIHKPEHVVNVNNELANSVDKMMKTDDDDDFFIDEIIDLDFDEDVDSAEPIDIETTKDNIEIKRSGDSYVNPIEEIYQIDGTDLDNLDEIKPNKSPKVNKEPEDDMDEFYEEEIEEFKNFKIKAIIIAVVGLIMISLIGITLYKMDSGNIGKSDFESIFEKGSNYSTDKDFDKALECYKEARQLAEDDKKKIKADKAILNIYEKRDGTENEQVELLKELIELTGKYEYYQKLVDIYDSRGDTAELSALIDSIQDETVKANLADYYSSVPKFSEEDGTYDHYLSIKIISAYNIYYTIDGSEPTTESTPYTTEIILNKQGTFIIKAISVNDKGIVSKVGTATYNIQPEFVAAPDITPSGGDYTESQEITVTVPEGMTCYYTYDEEGTEPTTESAVYSGPVKMLRGKNIFSAILVNKSGKASDATQVIYRLNIEAVITYSDALVTIGNYLQDNGIAARVDDENYVKSDGHMIALKYVSMATIDDCDYFVIDVQEYIDENVVSSGNYYGVNTVTRDLKELEQDPLDSATYTIINDNAEETTE